MFSWLISGLVFAAALLLALTLQRAESAARLRRQALAVTAVGDVTAKPTKHSPLREAFFALLPRLSAFQTRWVPQPWGQRVEKQLAVLPDWQGRPAGEWLAAKELAALAGLLAGGAVGLDLGLTLALGAGSFFLPDLWLRQQDQKRRRGLMRELPNFLDLLSTCMEAGLGFEPALGVILERGGRGVLQAEFGEAMRQIRMGLARRDALIAMAQRIDEPEFTTLVTAVVQAEYLGVSLTATLKTQAAQLRIKWSQRVEKLALEAPVKLLFPLIVFIFPVVFMILFGPIIIRFLQGF